MRKRTSSITKAQLFLRFHVTHQLPPYPCKALIHQVLLQYHLTSDNFQLLKREKKICGLRSSDLIPLGSFDKMEALIRNNRSNETNRNNGSELSERV